MNNVTIKGKLGAGYVDDRYTLPKGGEAGDILVKTETGSEWQKQEPATSTPDWDQNDSSASDYIKNRPCYASKTPNWNIIQQGTIGSSPSYEYISGGSYPSLYEQAMSFQGSVKGEFSIMIHNSDYSSVYDEKLTVVRDDTSVGAREYVTSDGKITVRRTVTELNSTITFGDSGFAEQSYTLRFNVPALTYHPLDDGYIPDTVQRVGADVIIPSSTVGSTKRFKITVDDSGTISASEVT